MRLPGWEQALVSYTRANLRTPYRWGLHDCALFAASCVKVITGQDFAEGLRGTYNDEDGARRVLASLGCADVGDLASRYLPEISRAEPRRGDIVMNEGAFGPFLAVVDGRTSVGPSARGLTHTIIDHAIRAWAVD